MSKRSGEPFKKYRRRLNMSSEPPWMLPILVWFHKSSYELGMGKHHNKIANMYYNRYIVEKALDKLKEHE